MAGTAVVEIRVDGPARRWHADLVRRIARPGTHVQLAVGPVDATTRGVDALMTLERLLHGLGDQARRPVDPPPPVRADDEPGIVLDLTARPDRERAWWVSYDGSPGERSLLASLRRGVLPVVEVRDPAGSVVAAGRPGSEHPGLLAAAYSDVLAGTTTLVVGALAGSVFCEPVPAPATPPAVPPRVPLLAAKRVTSAVAHRGYRALYRAPHWRVGWRLVQPDAPDVVDLGTHPGGGWTDLPDDGHRFYADPFPFVREDRTWLFVEDFAHRTGKGVISVVEFGDTGPLGTPRPVLTHRAHLSYPLVFAHDGETWMIPETCGAGTVELYRADRFPDRWTRERVLLSGLEASDATVFRHDDRWWMFATVRDGGSFSDALHIWHAEQLTGPWRRHGPSAALVDIASARPAGHVVRREGRLLRPVQDNRGGYGAALRLMEIVRLDDDGFEQKPVAELGPGAVWPGRRLHTLNRAGALEVIDGSAMAPRLRRRRQPT